MSIRVIDRTPEIAPECTVEIRYIPRKGFGYLQSHATIACECGFRHEGFGSDAIAGAHLRNDCPMRTSNGVTHYSLRIVR